MDEPLTIEHLLKMRKMIHDMIPTLWFVIAPKDQQIRVGPRYGQEGAPIVWEDGYVLFLEATALTPRIVIVKDAAQLERLAQSMPQVRLKDLKEWKPQLPSVNLEDS